ncbi:MAG: DUF484 family protein [Alphaproteobacteria bacterium]|nr:DUF484 family protein [Alphaproteobacteria bacterium]
MTNSEPRSPAKPRQPSAKSVAEFLAANPSFLVDHPELVGVLAPPSQSGLDGVLDMQQFMIERLQAELRDLRSSQRDLLSASRVNLSSQERIHAAVLAVIEARTLEDIGRIVAEDYRSILDVSTSALCFEEPGQSRLHNIISLNPGTIRQMMGDRSILLRHDIAGDERLYGGDAGKVRSDALVHLNVGKDGPNGLLALGSLEPDRFHPGQGTELLGFMARAITGSLRAGLNAA